VKREKKTAAPSRNPASAITIPAEPKAGATVLVEKIGLERALKFHEAIGELLEADKATKKPDKAKPIQK
jgi:hypothetical protein